MFPQNFSHIKYANFLKKEFSSEQNRTFLHTFEDYSILSFEYPTKCQIIIHEEGKIEFEATYIVERPIPDFLPELYIRDEIYKVFPNFKYYNNTITYKEVFRKDKSKGRTFLKQFFYNFIDKIEKAHKKLIKKLWSTLNDGAAVEAILSEAFAQERIPEISFDSKPKSKKLMFFSYMDVLDFVQGRQV